VASSGRESAIAAVQLASTAVDVPITVGPTGALTELVLAHWGNPDGASFGLHLFSAAFQDEISFGGVTVPPDVSAGWHYGTARWPEGQFIRYTIDKAGTSKAVFRSRTSRRRRGG
jgi:Family of unknown function (DUF6544)